MSVLGKALPHESARDHVTGAALYTDDLVGRFPGALHAWPVTAPHAHANVKSIDTQPARAIPGVTLILTAADVPGENQIGPARPDEPLFPTEVMFHGQPVAWVLGETEEAARIGASKVVVVYEELPAILSIEAAISADSFLTGELRLAQGDAAAALARAPRRLSGELFVGGQEHFYLETHAALAHLDEQDRVFVHSSTQHPSETQEIVSRVLGVHKHDVTVQSLRMGGAFGGKEVQANAWAAVAALGCRKTGRPVRVRLNRAQDTSMTGKRHPFLGRFEVGFDDSGKLLALRMQLFADGGFSLDLSEPILYRALFHSDNTYLLPDVELTGRVVLTHKTSMTAFRGFGGPQGMVMIEEIMDRIARTLGVPPHQVRANNFYREGDRTPYGQVVRDAERIGRIWSELLASSAFSERWQKLREHNRENPHSKRGLAITPVKFGISFTTAFFNQGGALVLIYADGSVQVNHGGTEMGQGLHTKMLQVAAHTLGVGPGSIRMMPTQTDKVPNTSATAASSGADLNGAAIKAACETLRERLAEVAAKELGVTADDVEFEDGRVFARGAPEPALSFEHVTHQAYLARVPLFSSGYYRTPEIHFDKATGTGKPFHYFAYGAAVTEVLVDGFTGMYSIERVDILHDVGDSLSPLLDIGQVEGGYIQGLGWLTLEELVWTGDGRLATPNASTYKLPGLGECPPVFEVKLLERATEPDVVYGSKAVGEPPLMLAISAREALRQAVSAFGNERPGVVDLASPATPEAVFWAIEKVRAASSGAERAAE
ncbi:MAG: xanthine dehydrogenase molybdopterin binding subunit [Myxococcales bacterium]|nr:xanthine dehydrogenase molybdopterin binding subunit [Myxococcales bacterium]